MFRTIACVFSNSAVQLQVCFNKVELYSVLPEWCQRFCTIEYFHDSPEAMLCFARIKMETRHPVKGYIGSEFPAICSHCRVMAALSRKTLKFVRNFCVFFLEKRSRFQFQILFRKFLSRHRSTCCDQISWNLADWKSVKSCVIYMTYKTKFRLDRARICHGQPPTTYSECSRVQTGS